MKGNHTQHDAIIGQLMHKIGLEIDVVISWEDKQTVVAQGCENKSCMKQFICCNCSKLQGVSRGKNRHPEDSKKSKMLWRKLSWRKALQQIKKAKKMWKEVHEKLKQQAIYHKRFF